MRKRRATKTPRSGLLANRLLEELGGIAGLLQTCSKGAWPEDLDLAAFEAVFGLIVDRCRNEFGARPFLAYLCRALIEQSMAGAFRGEPLAARRVELMMKAGIRQAPFLLDDLRLAEQLTAAFRKPGVIVLTAKGRRRRITLPETFGTVTVLPMVGKELIPLRDLVKRSMKAAGRSIAGLKPGAPRAERVNKREVLERVERETQEIAAREGKRGARKKALAAERDRQGVSVDAVVQQIKRAKRDNN